MTLGEVLDVAAAAQGVSATSGDGDATSWSHDGVVFARLDATGMTASFRLDPVLAAAARRTPDTTASASASGPDWVDFRPRILDGPAADRATAWFGAAARRAGVPA